MACCIEGCDRPVKYAFKKLCAMHYQRIQRYGSPDKIDRKRYCWICKKPAKAYGWCDRHWQRICAKGTWKPGKWSHEHEEECVVPRCLKSVRCMGLCSSYYRAEYKRGHPLWRTQNKERISPERPWTSEAVVDFNKIIEHNRKRKLNAKVGDRRDPWPSGNVEAWTQASG